MVDNSDTMNLNITSYIGMTQVQFRYGGLWGTDDLDGMVLAQCPLGARFAIGLCNDLWGLRQLL